MSGIQGELWPDRSDGRKLHYGEGRQPIDDWRDNGFLPVAYAAHIHKYLRRPGKAPEHSLESARRYYKWLCEAANEGYSGPFGSARDALIALGRILTPADYELLIG